MAGERRICDRLTVTAKESITYYDIGKRLAKHVGVSDHFVLPTLSEQMPIGEERCGLCYSLGLAPPSAWFAVDEVLESL